MYKINDNSFFTVTGIQADVVWRGVGVVFAALYAESAKGQRSNVLLTLWGVA